MTAQEMVLRAVQDSRNEDYGCSIKELAKAITDGLHSSEIGLLVVYINEWIDKQAKSKKSANDVALPF